MIHRFGPFELDDGRFELRRDGVAVPLQARPLDVLLTLVRNRGVVLSPAQLMATVWPNVVVTKDSLTQAMMAVRKALGDDIDQSRYVQTVRKRGYCFVGDLIEGAPLQARDKRTVAASTALVGREQELVALRAALDGAMRGPGRLALVVGEAGVGKTRLVDELVAAAGAPAIVVSCRVPKATPEPWPVVEIVRALAGHGVKLDPALADSIDDIPAALAASEPAAFRFLDRAASALVDFASERALLVAIDDLHLAGASTLALVELVAARLRTAKLLLVCAYRPGSSSVATFDKTLSALAREPRASSHRLLPLSRDETASYVQQATGRAPSEAVVDRLFDKTKGSPLYLSELVHVLRAEEALRGDVATTALVGGDGMKGAVAQHLASLPDEVTRTLAVAAVFGRSFAVAPLAVVLETTNERVLEHLDVAAEARIVARAGADRHRFTYPLVRDLVYRSLPATERAKTHGRAARALAERVTGDDHAEIGSVAAHFVESAPAGDVDLAVEWTLRAARLAADAGDPKAAAAYAALGLRALGFAHKPDGPSRDRLRAFTLRSR